MSYCSSHNKLAEAKNLCIHCSSSRPPRDDDGGGVSSTAAFFTWMTGGEGDNRCSCCDLIFNRPVYPHSMMSKNSLDFILEYFQKNKMSTDDDHNRKKAEIVEECVSHDSNLEVQELDSIQTSDDPFSNLGCNEDDDELMDSDRFICIELINTDAAANDAREIPSTNSLEDVGARFDDVLEGSDVDVVDSPSRPTGEDEERLGARSREIDGIYIYIYK